MKRLKKLVVLFIVPIIILSLYIIGGIVYGALMVNDIKIPSQVVLQVSLIPVYSSGFFIAPLTFLFKRKRMKIKMGINKAKK